MAEATEALSPAQPVAGAPSPPVPRRRPWRARSVAVRAAHFSPCAPFAISMRIAVTARGGQRAPRSVAVASGALTTAGQVEDRRPSRAGPSA